MEESSILSVSHSLNQLSAATDLMNPEAVKGFIANMTNQKTGEPLSNASKQKHANNYNYFVTTHGLKWEKPKYKIAEIIPIIPKESNVNRIISTATPKFATIFTILAETGLEGAELASMARKQIDTEQGIISAVGCKGHASRTFKLKSRTAEMLRIYMYKHPEEKPFPKAKIMGQMWRRFRDRLAEKLNEPDLKKVQMRNLRNYSGARFYAISQDPIATMRYLGHKKLETTMHYLRSIVTNGEVEYTTKAVKTLQEAIELSDAGFTYVTDMGEYKLFRKRK